MNNKIGIDKLFFQDVKTGKTQEIKRVRDASLYSDDSTKQTTAPLFELTDGDLTIDLKDCYIYKWHRIRKGKRYLFYKKEKISLMRDFFKKIFGIKI